MLRAVADLYRANAEMVAKLEDPTVEWPLSAEARREAAALLRDANEHLMAAVELPEEETDA